MPADFRFVGDLLIGAPVAARADECNLPRLGKAGDLLQGLLHELCPPIVLIADPSAPALGDGLEILRIRRSVSRALESGAPVVGMQDVVRDSEEVFQRI